ERGDISSANLVSSKAIAENKNPEYIFNEPPKINLPKINNRDNELRKMEEQLLSDKVKEEIPQMDPNEYDKGDEVGIWVDNPDGSWSEVETTVRGVGDHSYILVDNSMDFITDEMIQDYVDEFDNKIYDNNTDFYASGHDIDQNEKVMISLIDMGGPEDGAITMGYFWGKDFYTQEELNDMGYEGTLYSNEADIIYLNGAALEHDFSAEDHLSTIAHEFQHLQWYYNCWKKDAEHSDTWINEGMSTYAEQLNDYTEVDGRIYTYFDDGYTPQLDDISQASLFYWGGNLADYGLSNLFTNYLTEQYGESILNNVYDDVSAEVSPMDIVESSSNEEMTDIFMNFIVANKLHSLDLSTEYSYDLSLEGDPVHTSVTSQYNGEVSEIKNSAVKYYKVVGTGQDVELDINGSITDQKVGAFIYRY
ncbi:MAG: hypothetical protein ACOCRK_10935, partial [bacterium]